MFKYKVVVYYAKRASTVLHVQIVMHNASLQIKGPVLLELPLYLEAMILQIVHAIVLV